MEHIPKIRFYAEGKLRLARVSYTYVKNGERFHGTSICLCLPIGMEPETKDKRTVVYVGPIGSLLPVLVKGPHFFLPILLAVLGVGLLSASQLISRYIGLTDARA